MTVSFGLTICNKTRFCSFSIVKNLNQNILVKETLPQVKEKWDWKMENHCWEILDDCEGGGLEETGD